MRRYPSVYSGFWDPRQVTDVSERLSQLTHTGYDVFDFDAVMFCHQFKKHKLFDLPAAAVAYDGV